MGDDAAEGRRETVWTISAPANGAESIFSGVEFTWQHIMENGFGTRMQYTATKTRSYDQSGNFVGAINAAPPIERSICCGDV